MRQAGIFFGDRDERKVEIRVLFRGETGTDGQVPRMTFVVSWFETAAVNGTYGLAKRDVC